MRRNWLWLQSPSATLSSLRAADTSPSHRPVLSLPLILSAWAFSPAPQELASLHLDATYKCQEDNACTSNVRQWKKNKGGEMLSHPILWKVTRRVDSRGSEVITCTFLPSVPTSAFPSLLSFVPSECPILSNSSPKDCFYRNPIQNVGLVNKLLRRNREGYSLTDKSTSTWPWRIERSALLSS